MIGVQVPSYPNGVWGNFLLLQVQVGTQGWSWKKGTWSPFPPPLTVSWSSLPPGREGAGDFATRIVGAGLADLQLLLLWHHHHFGGDPSMFVTPPVKAAPFACTPRKSNRILECKLHRRFALAWTLSSANQNLNTQCVTGIHWSDCHSLGRRLVLGIKNSRYNSAVSVLCTCVHV